MVTDPLVSIVIVFKGWVRIEDAELAWEPGTGASEPLREIDCTPTDFTLNDIRPNPGNRAGVRDGPAASTAQMGTRLATFSAQFLASCAAKSQVSGLHPGTNRGGLDPG